MVCIYCGSETRVVNSRPQKRSNYIWRRRQCGSCTAIFTTSETPDFLKSLSVRHGADLQPFSRDKLFLTVYDSLKHRKSATRDATGITDTILSKLMPFIHAATIERVKIIESTLAVLKRFDKAAATHYLAYHPIEP